jgi:hypothetical protein
VLLLWSYEKKINKKERKRYAENVKVEEFIF